MRKKGFPTSIHATLDTYLRKRGWTGKLHEYRIWTHWEEVIGKKLASNSQPLRLKDKVLTVGVKNNAWLTQLQFMKIDLIDKIAKELDVKIKDIFFRILK